MGSRSSAPTPLSNRLLSFFEILSCPVQLFALNGRRDFLGPRLSGAENGLKGLIKGWLHNHFVPGYNNNLIRPRTHSYSYLPPFGYG